MSVTTRHPFFWVPNFLTLGRIALIPVIMWGILAVGQDSTGLMNTPTLLIALFVISALSDFFDGFLARRWHLVSDFGRMLDPIADKLSVAGCLIAINLVLGPNWTVLVPSMLIIFRDIFISGTREHAANANIILSPTKLAKWKTTFEVIAILLYIVGFSAKSLHSANSLIEQTAVNCMVAGLAVLWLAALLSVYTGLHYVRAAFKKA